MTLFDPFAAAADPFPAFAAARAAGGVVPGVPPYPELSRAVYLFRHGQVGAALRHPKLLQAPPGTYQAVRQQMLTHHVWAVLTRCMMLADPPYHALQRRPLTSPVGPQRMAEFSQWLRATAAERVAALVRRGRFDAIADLVVPFAVDALARVLGIPLPELGALKRATASIATAIDLRREPASAESDRACAWLIGEIEAAIDRGAVEPGGIAAAMLAEERAGRWERADVVANLVFMVMAGQETTIDSFGNALLLLEDAPAQRRLLEERKVGWSEAAEELLRLGPAVHYATARIAAEEFEIEGVLVPAGSGVIAVVASANRDSAVFPQGEALDLQRLPRATMTFGSGIHSCYGQHVARLEIAILLEALFTLAPGWRAERDGVTYRRLLSFRGPTTLPVIV